ncbi:MAG: alginate lyase family protein [Pirellulales bacterium]|nr:alginate lyase family protein [Pirellulales bacterium]
MDLRHLARTVRTLRHLRLSQMWWRLCYRVEQSRPPGLIRAPVGLVVKTDFPEVPLVGHRAEDVQSELVEQLQQGTFSCLGQSRQLGRKKTDWLLGERGNDRLWVITLHYHQWVWKLAALIQQGGPTAELANSLLRHYLADWIGRCDLIAPGSRALAWNAYAIATRLGWWCRLYHLLGESGRTEWGPLEGKFLESLWRQAAYLHGHLEWDLRANHLLRDAVGLAWAGRFFDNPEARRWLDTATRLAVEQAAEQVLPDGGHFERSPMYHLHVMEDFLTLAFLLEDESARETMRQTWLRMAELAKWARHPDGQIPLLNDAALNGACRPDMMLAEGRAALGQAWTDTPAVGGRLFPDFGLAVWHGDPWSVFFDVGSVGVDYQPGHAHADTLTFEASYRGRRLFVDPGTYCYDNNKIRRYDRGTAAHNTVCLDGVDSSEVWHIFRVGRRARSRNVEVKVGNDRFSAIAAHSGYRGLTGRPSHQRTIEAVNADGLTLLDQLDGQGRHEVSEGLLVAPSWQVEPLEQGWRLRHGDDCVRVWVTNAVGPLTLEYIDAAYHPAFGVEESTRRLTWHGMLDLPCQIVVHVQPDPSHA